MNKKQKQMMVILSAVALFSLSELFPPFSYKDEYSRQRSAGYHFFYNPPTTIKVPTEMSASYSTTDEQFRHFRIGRNRIRLFGQRLILLFVMLGLLLLLEERRSKLKTVFGVISLCFGFAVLALYVFYISIIG